MGYTASVCQYTDTAKWIESWTYLEMKRLFALSANVIRRLSTAERMMTPV